MTTPEHPFYVPVRGWIKAINLRAGDILVTVNGEYKVVEEIQHEILEAPVKVYNFEVEDFHTYYVSDLGVLVHNGCETDTQYEDYAKKATKNDNSNEVILGKHNQDGISYSKVAEKRNATYFELDDWDNIANTLGEENMWNINKQFLNQQWNSGKDFYLSHNPWEATGYFEKEILHLIDLGAKDFVKIDDLWKVVR